MLTSAIFFYFYTSLPALSVLRILKQDSFCCSRCELEYSTGKFNLSKILRSMTSIGKKREERYVYGTNYFGNKIETPIKDYRL